MYVALRAIPQNRLGITRQIITAEDRPVFSFDGWEIHEVASQEEAASIPLPAVPLKSVAHSIIPKTETVACEVVKEEAVIVKNTDPSNDEPFTQSATTIQQQAQKYRKRGRR